MPEHTFPGNSELAARMRALDWSRSPLGEPARWPQSLKTAVRIILTSRQPMWIGWGPELTYFYNDAYRSIIGARHPWALGRPLAEVWREIWHDIEPMLAVALAGDEGTYVEAQQLIMERNGYPEETYYTFSYSPIPDDDGSVGGILCANSEDTPRVMGERQLALLRELAADTAEARTERQAFARIAQALATNPFDLPVAILYVVEPGASSFALAATAGIDDGHPASPREVALDAPSPWPLAETLRGNRTVVVDLDAATPLPSGAWPAAPTRAALVPIHASGESGRAGVLVVALNPFRLFDDAYQGFLELVAGQIAAGIANANAYEEERRRAEALAELDRAKTAFFSNVSHEFRTPLTLMLGPIADILSKPDDDVLPDNRRLLEVASRNGLRLLRLVNTLLDFSRIEAGRVQASYRPIDLAAYTAELASNFRSACERAGLRLVVECPPLPEPVFVDPEMWEKVVLNLVSNAFKFTFAGEIVVSVAGRDGAAELRVRDTGTGVPAAELPRLFERFHRVENARSRTHEGSGIGLALVQELVRLHGGAVGVESVEGEGTTFTVRVPLGSAHLPPERIAAPRTLASSATGASAFVEEAMRWLPVELRDADEAPRALIVDDGPAPHEPRPHDDGGARPRVLVVDDNADMRHYVVRVLAGRFDVESAPDGEAALGLIGDVRPDVVLTDVMMPHLDGFGLLRALREDARTRDVPVILLTARAGEESRIEGLEAGADDYLEKPFSARELLARVAAQLQIASVRRDASGSLRTSEERLRMALTAARMVAWEFDVSSGRVIVSSNAGDVLPLASGATVERIDEWYALIHDDDLEWHRATVERAIAARESYVSQFRQVDRATGRTVWLEEFANAVADGAGEDVRVVGVVSDITGRKRAEQLQAGQRHVLELVAKDAPLADVFTALVRMMEAQSDAGMLGSIQLLDDDRVHLRHGAAPSLPEAYNAAIDGIAIGEAVGSCGTAAFRREPVYVSDIAGDPLWSDHRELALAHGLGACWSIPIFSSGGALFGTFAMYYPHARTPNEHDLRLVDVATRTAAIAIERRRATEALRYRSEQFETLLNQAPLGVYLVDADFRIREINPVALPVFGRIEGGVVGRDIGEILHILWENPYADEVVRIFRHTLVTGESYVADERSELRADRGAIEYYEWRLDRITLPDGRYGLVCYFRDISQQVLARRAIEESREALREADRRKDEFLATLAHELRNPLAPLRSGLELMKLAANDPEVVEQTHEMMKRQLAQMVRLIDDLLDISRITRGKIELRKEPVDIARVVLQAVETSQPHIDAWGHTLALDLHAEPLHVEGDPIRLAQVFSNLLNNAAKFTPRAGAIAMRVERAGGDVMVSVGDTGIGIPEEMLPRVFEMFTQLDREPGRTHGGLGIGLSLVRGIVELHGGTVEARSDGDGRGSEFRVRLPLVAASVRDGGDGRADEPAALARGRRILVVDDNRDAALSLAMALRLAGSETLTAHDGEEAVFVAGEFRPDLILLDIGMPRLNGIDAARQIRAQEWGRGIVLVALSGWGQEEYRRRSHEAGFDGHLVKPVDHAALLRLVGELPARG